MAQYADHNRSAPADAAIRMFLCGDVMLGRGIDQVLPHPCSPELHESYVGSALDYVRLAEHASEPISFPVDLAYVWGAALDEVGWRQSDVRIINLETSITRSDDFAPKGINYRMSPKNAGCLVRAGISCCVLANNHVLDWGGSGLLETLTTLDRLGITYAGAGRNSAEAGNPAVLDCGGKGRVVVFSFASVTSGVSRNWAAKPDFLGINLLTDMSEATASGLGDRIVRRSRPGDIVVVSFHWGPNWGYEIPEQQRRFAHSLIDHAGVSVVHGHSSHHAKAIEVYRDRLILYGCGDFLNDYEGITGYEEYRDDLAVMYFAEFDRMNGNLIALDMAPLQIRRFRLNRASNHDIDWLRQTLDRESQNLVRGSSAAWVERSDCPGPASPGGSTPLRKNARIRIRPLHPPPSTWPIEWTIRCLSRRAIPNCQADPSEEKDTTPMTGPSMSQRSCLKTKRWISKRRFRPRKLVEAIDDAEDST